MTNSETVRSLVGVAITGGAAGVSYADQIEQWSRIGASWVAIVTGCLVIWSVVSKHFNKKK